MTDQELGNLAKNLESDLVERKASLADKERIGQAICAFANDLPNHQKSGVIFVGLNDDSTCANWQVSDQRLQELADMRSNGNIHPFPSMTVEKRIVRSCEVAVVIVRPSDDTPIRYKGVTWIRVGPRRATATQAEERILTEKRRARDLPYDLRPLDSANLEDLDSNLFRQEYLPSSIATEILEQNQRSLEEQLASLRFISVAPEVKPTVLGMLVAGKESRRFIPGAYVQFLRVDGITLANPIKSQKEISGPLTQLFREMEEVLRAHVSISSDVSQSVEVRRPDYPIEALRQLVRNAVLHRTYEGTNAPVRITWFNDRIEILSPGGPFGQVNEVNFGKPGVTDYRNPHLAEAMKNLGYVQRFGIGIPLAEQALQDNGNPRPKFCIEDSHILVIIGRNL
ncbi:MAG: putative DNA binding domain-containing protein [Elusimicrobia bacterium]|nr:putative DNA binding domain-containing protein [Elusimicrobiota bacterium]